jgi:transposase-like protein
MFTMTEDPDIELPEDQIRKIKTREELDDNFTRLYKQLVETMLKAEMEEHLGYKKHDPAGNKSGNSRNGTSSKTLKTNIGEIPLAVPPDRN